MQFSIDTNTKTPTREQKRQADQLAQAVMDILRERWTFAR